MTVSNPMRLKSSSHFVVSILAGILLAQAMCGCAHSRPRSGDSKSRAGVLLPKLTAVFAGPVSSLLTNAAGFQSELAISWDDTPPLKMEGWIFVEGGKLRIEAGSGSSKRANTGEFGLIWDVAANRGYVTSEALQGYAPIQSAIRVTNLTTQALPGQPQQLQDHPTDKAQVTITGSDGHILRLELTRAQDLGNLPLKIDSTDSGNSFHLALTKIRSAVQGEDLFLPPDGFTPYGSQTALIEELAARQQTVFGAGATRIRDNAGGEQETPPPPSRANEGQHY